MARGFGRNDRALDQRDVLSLALPQRVRVLSIDLFGTLLVRETASPNTAAREWACSVVKWARSVGRSSPTTFELMKARQEAMRRWVLPCTHDRCERIPVQREIVGSVIDNAYPALPAAERERLIDEEVAAEYKWSRPDEALVACISRARERGLRVVATSDMHLSASQLRALLAMHRLPEFDRVLASSDEQVSKFSGGLFRRLLQLEGVPASEVVHLGDDWLTDVLSAREIGLFAAHRRADSVSGDASGLRAFGYDVLGPVFEAFGRLLVDELERARPEIVAFVARDGDLLQRVHSTLLDARADRDAPQPRIRYVELSRRTTAAASTTRIDRKLARELLTVRSRNCGLVSLLTSLGLPVDPFRPHLERLGWGDAARPIADPERDPALTRLLGDEAFQAHVSRELEAARLRLRAYLDSLGFFGPESAVLVDVGWRGSTQSHLERAFSGDPGWPATSGLYLGFWDDGFLNAPSDADRKLGLLCDYRRGRDVVEGAAFRLSCLLESTCRARHGTVVGYAPCAGAMRAVRAESTAARAAEARAESVTDPIREGILAWVAHHGSDPSPPTATLRRRAQSGLARLAYFPTRTEIDLASRLVVTESADDDWAVHGVPRDPPSLLRDPRRWIAGLDAPWRGAYVAQTTHPVVSVAYALAESAVLFVPRDLKAGLRSWVIAWTRRGR